jgi:hypothetical protein
MLIDQSDTKSNCHPEPSESAATAGSDVSKDPEDADMTMLPENSSTMKLELSADHRKL